MFIVNGTDIQDQLMHSIPQEYRFADAPGSIQYLPLSRFNFNNRSGELSPHNPDSPLHLLAQGQTLTATVSDNSNNYTVIITEALDQNGELVLITSDSNQQILNKAQVVLSLELMTPIEILRNISISYGLLFDSTNFAQIKQDQENAGLIFNFTVNIGDSITVQDAMTQVSQAGFMRACIYHNTVFAIHWPWEGGYPIDIYPQEVLSVPTQSEVATRRLSGGTVNWAFGDFTEPNDPALGGELTLDYSDGKTLELVNPDGALSLLQLYSNPKINPIYEVDLLNAPLQDLKPGSKLRFLPNILRGGQAVEARLLGKRRKSPYDNFIASCTVELDNA